MANLSVPNRNLAGKWKMPTVGIAVLVISVSGKTFWRGWATETAAVRRNACRLFPASLILNSMRTGLGSHKQKKSLTMLCKIAARHKKI